MADVQRALHEFKDACISPLARQRPSVFRDKFWELCYHFSRRSVALDVFKRALQAGETSQVPNAQAIMKDALWYCSLQCADQKDRLAELAQLLPELAVKQGETSASKGQDQGDTFTLFQDANEGYSKLMLELMEVHTNKQNKNLKLPAVMAKIQCLVGHFKLDPYRVHALILDAFEGDMNNLKYIRLLKNFPFHEAAASLGFQFRYYFLAAQSASTNSSRLLYSKEDAHSLFIMTAMLLKHEVISLADIYPFLQPPDQEMMTQQKRFISAKVAEAKKWGSVNLREDAPVRAFSQGGDIPSDIPQPTFLNEANQKFHLIMALLSSEAFDVALDMLTMMSSVDPLAYPPLLQETCTQVGVLMEPLYAAVSSRSLLEGTPAATPSTKEQQIRFAKYGFPLLHSCGSHLSNDVELLTKLCRVIRTLQCSPVAKEIDVEQWVEKLAVRVLFPAIAVMVPLPSLCYELWDVLKSMPFEQRFRIYGQFQAQGYNPPHYRLVLARIQAMRETSNICKRIAKESTKPFGRSLAKIAHCNPLVAFEKIIEQAMAYENLIPCLVEMVRYVTPLAMDMVVYQTLVEMAVPDKLRMKDDTTYSNWLTHLGTFAGTYFRKYHNSLDLKPMLQYILRKLRSGETSDLVVIQELMRQMTGLETMETNVTDAQLQAHAGGPVLRFMAGGHAQTLSNVSLKMIGKASKRLRDRLVWGGMAAPMLLLLAQLRGAHLLEHGVHADEGKLQRVSEAHDEATNTLILMVHFLTRGHAREPKDTPTATTPATATPRDKDGDGEALDVPEVGMALPKLAVMVQEFDIEVEVAFALTRPNLRDRPLWKDADVKEHLGEVIGPGPLRLPRPSTLSRSFYYVFWTLDLYDILVPKNQYEDSMSKLRQEITEHENKLKYSSDHTMGRKDIAALLKEDLNGLNAEYKEQVQNSQAVQARLADFRDSNPLGGIEKSTKGYEVLAWDFLQECVLPRCTLSMLDAIYCGEFLKLIHALKLPLNMVILCHNIACHAASWLAFLTECEAQRVGKFLAIMLEMLLRWRLSEFQYEKECDNHPGFRDNPRCTIAFRTYKQVHFMVHDKLAKGFVRLLTSSELVEQRNCLLVLGLLKDVYPQHTSIARGLQTHILALREKPGLKALAESCHSLLLHKKYNSDLDVEDQQWERDRRPSPSPSSSSRPSEFRKREREPVDSSSTSKRPRDDVRIISDVTILKPKPEAKVASSGPTAATKPKEEKKPAASPSTTSTPTASTTKPSTTTASTIKPEAKSESVIAIDSKKDVKPVAKEGAPAAKKPPTPLAISTTAKKEEAKPAVTAVKKDPEPKVAVTVVAKPSPAPKKTEEPKRRVEGTPVDVKDPKKPKPAPIVL